VLSLLKEAVASTGTGEVKREFFKAIFPFPLDDFQLAALDALGGRENVVVSAPTGSGKKWGREGGRGGREGRNEDGKERKRRKENP